MSIVRSMRGRRWSPHAHHLELTNVALAGQCQLDPFMGRVIRDAPADVISLKIGINLVSAASMNEGTFAPAVHGLAITSATVTLQHRSSSSRPSSAHSSRTTLARPFHVNAAGSTSCRCEPPPARSGSPSAASERCWPPSSTHAAVQATRTCTRSMVSPCWVKPINQHLLHDRLHPSPEGYALLGGRFATVLLAPGGAFAER